MFPTHNWTRKLIKAALLLAVMTFAPKLISAQDIVIDWAGSSETPDAYPAQVNRSQTFTVTVKNINNILYTYSITHTFAPLSPDDFSNLSAIVNKGSLAACKPLDDLKIINRDIDNSDALPPKMLADMKAGKAPKSIPLQQSLDAWRPLWEKVAKLGPDAAATCSGSDPADYRSLYDADKKIQERAESSHTLTDTARIEPDTNNTFTIREYFSGVETKTKVVHFQSVSNRLTLSAGALFSRVPNRTYTPRKTPASTENVLVVEGNSRYRPEGVALLNYTIPLRYIDGDTAGLALSAGPVVRFGSSSDTSGLGFFTGLSAHLYHRLYITPGLHFGQFADFPIGFGNGSTVPANFGEVNPVKRWTGRFAVAVSFRAANFSSLTQSAAPKVTSSDSSDKSKDKDKGKTSSIERSLSTEFAAHVQRNIEALPGPLRALNSSALVSSEKPLMKNIALLSSSETSEGSRISINADASLNDYSVYFDSGRFYVVIPHAGSSARLSALRGRDFSDAQVEQRGDDFVITVVLPPGTKAHVLEKFNRLDVIFSAQGDSSLGLGSQSR